MPFSLVSSLGVGLTLALLGTAHAEPTPPPPPPDRVVIGEISRGCSRDGEGTRAIIARLRQGGVRVDSTPLGRPECVGPNCAEKLGEKDKEGYLLGGDIRPTESTLWLVDLKTDQIYVRRYLSNGEADLTVLARQAGTLLDVLHDPLTRWTPRKSTPTCSDALPDPTSMETTVSAPPIPRSDMRVALAVHAPRSIEKYATEFQKGVRRSLSEMGLDVREVRGIAPPANPRGALPTALLDLPLIDVQLLAPDGDQAKPAPDGATIRLSDSRGATQTTLDCATQDCTPTQLVRFVRRNAAVLVDGGSASATLHTNKLGSMCLPAVMVCQNQLAQAGTSRATHLGTISGSAHPESSGAVVAASPGTGSQSAPPKRHAVPTGYWAGSAILTASGIAGVVASALFSKSNGQRVEGQLCPVGEAMVPCYQNTDGPLGLSIGIAIGGLGSGLPWLICNIYQHTKQEPQQKE